jgi:hypothetical protein
LCIRTRSGRHPYDAHGRPLSDSGAHGDDDDDSSLAFYASPLGASATVTTLSQRTDGTLRPYYGADESTKQQILNKDALDYEEYIWGPVPGGACVLWKCGMADGTRSARAGRGHDAA